MEDDIICTEKIIAERKTFFLDLKQNARGKVVRITEKVSSNRDRIMVPAEFWMISSPLSRISGRH